MVNFLLLGLASIIWDSQPDDVPDDVAEEDGGVGRDSVPAGASSAAVDGDVDDLHAETVGVELRGLSVAHLRWWQPPPTCRPASDSRQHNQLSTSPLRAVLSPNKQDPQSFLLWGQSYKLGGAGPERFTIFYPTFLCKQILLMSALKLM